MADPGQNGEPNAGKSGPGGRSGGGGMLGDLVQAETIIQLAIMLPAACFIGWIAGLALDKHFHTGWMEIAGVVLGAVAGFVQIIRTASRYMKRDGS